MARSIPPSSRPGKGPGDGAWHQPAGQDDAVDLVGCEAYDSRGAITVRRTDWTALDSRGGATVLEQEASI